MKKIPNHVMIDLETMGKTPEAAIVSIGAVLFDPRYGIKCASEFYIELDWKNQQRDIDQETKAWWKKQDKSARKALSGKGCLDEALLELSKWLPKDAKVWGNGPTFDISIMENAYQDSLMEIPWKFWNVRCCRTIRDMYESKRGGINNNFIGQKHNALDDAKYQAEYVVKMWKELLS